MDPRSGKRVSAVGLPRCAVGQARIDSRLRPRSQETRRLVFATKSAAGFFSGAPTTNMSDLSRGRAERVELRSKVNSEFGSERAAAYPQQSGFSARPLESGLHAVDPSFASAEPLGKRRLRASSANHATNPHSDPNARTSEFYPAHVLHPRVVHGQLHENAKKPLRVMKFGGTSVGDAPCIERVVAIVRAATRESDVVVVVSAMSGVTNKLVEAASQSQAGNSQLVAAIFEELRTRHEDAANALIHSGEKRPHLSRKMRGLLHEGERLCQDAMQRLEMTPRTRDAISGLGERLSAPLVAAALA